MSKASVLDQGWIDLVFEGRNQSYGAYQLRRQDGRTTMLALFAGIAAMGLFVSVPLAINYFSDEVIIPTEAPTLPETEKVVIADLPHKIEPPKPAVVEPAGGALIKEPTIALNTFVAATNPVPVDIPSTQDVLNTRVSSVTTTGNPNGSVTGTTPIGTPDGTGTGPVTGTGDGPIDANLVDEAPLYPGGLERFYKDVHNRFNVPEIESHGTIRVFVSFVVEKDGTLTDIKALNKPGHNLDKEAERVLRSLKKKWTPGKKAGQAVRTSYRLPIMIEVK